MKYFKQAWNLIKQEKLFSSIYIIGTGLSITIVMTLFIVFYIKIGNIYPETNRDRMLIIKGGEIQTENNTNSSYLSYGIINNCIKKTNSAEAIAMTYYNYEDEYIQLGEEGKQLQITTKYADEQFWKVFSFHFINGKAFTEADVQSGIRTAVISESLSKKLFGTTECIGEYLSLNFDSYRVCGVVKDVSLAFENSYAQLWVPYTVRDDYKEIFGPGDFLGMMNAFILAPSVKDLDQVKEDILENVKRYSSNYPGLTFTMYGQPDRHWENIFRESHQMPLEIKKIMWQYGIIIFVLLFIPAISLSGMTDSRMERRLSEMGIRRSFGAPVNNLMNQIISENFLFTFLGGVLGLLLSYLLLFVTRDWIFQLGSHFVDTPIEGTHVAFSFDMLFNIPVFLIALLVCFILNLLSALIPAWKASRRPIIYSLNAKQ